MLGPLHGVLNYPVFATGVFALVLCSLMPLWVQGNRWGRAPGAVCVCILSLSLHEWWDVNGHIGACVWQAIQGDRSLVGDLFHGSCTIKTKGTGAVCA